MNLINKLGIVSVGDRVAYPGRVSSSLWMNYGTVLDIYETKKRWSDEKVITLKIQREGDTFEWTHSTKPRVVTVVRTDNIVRIS